MIKYDGEWRKGKKHGAGVQVYPNGDVYEGSWVKNRREGRGVLRTSHGTVYQGEWKGGKKHGFGSQNSTFHKNWFVHHLVVLT